MANNKKTNYSDKPDIDNYTSAAAGLRAYPLFARLDSLVHFYESQQLPKGCWAQLREDDKGTTTLHINHFAKLSYYEWQYVLATAYLHVGLGHLQPKNKAWMVACELYTHRFLAEMGINQTPYVAKYPNFAGIPLKAESDLARFLMEEGDLSTYQGWGIGGTEPSWILADPNCLNTVAHERRLKAFAEGLKDTLQATVSTMAEHIGVNKVLSPDLQAAQQWIINSFPLLSALATAFNLIEDAEVCRQQHIEIAAVNPFLKEIYINPRWRFNRDELIFILLHEYLHVGLRHDVRAQGRDSYLWNVACDYVINGWLVEMRVGQIPTEGMLYDPLLAGRSAEDIYDEITQNLRWQRKLQKTKTPCANGMPDVIMEKTPSWWTRGEGVGLDEFYRRCLTEGLSYAQQTERGLFPAGLIEEIKAINQRPIPWDVKLTEWLDQFFPPLEPRRTYARISRRQSATPDIARPAQDKREVPARERTFGVLLDTSGSMSRLQLGMALGAIAAYAMSRDVRYVRLIYCDALPYDAGYMEAERLLERVEIKGRGGTVLQPAIDLLVRSDDFPQKGPLLIITDGMIDHIKVPMEHAYLMPMGSRLPFKTISTIFYFSD